MKSGRVRCGRCQRVLARPYDRRQPRPHELREIELATGMEEGRLRYRYSIPREVALDWPSFVYCPKCKVTYRPTEPWERLTNAYESGSDLFLTDLDIPKEPDSRNRPDWSW